MLTGSMEIRNNYEVVTLERTTDNELDQANPAAPAEGAEELRKLNSKDETVRDEALEIIWKKFDGKPVQYAATLRLWQHYNGADADPNCGNARSGRVRQHRRPTSRRELEIHAATAVARSLAARKNGADAAARLRPPRLRNCWSRQIRRSVRLTAR